MANRHTPFQQLTADSQMTGQAQDDAVHKSRATIGAALEAQRGERLQRAYLAVLAHEMRNPLGAIASAVEVLGRVGGQTASEVRAREVIKRQVQQLTQMLETLHSVPTAGDADSLEAVPVDLADTLRQAVQLAQYRQGVQRMKRHVGALAPEAVWVMGDPAALAQLALCLLDEARAHGSGGAILASVAEEQGHAVLRVQAGHDTQAAGNRVAPTVVPAGRRSIGMAWVRRLAEAQGGHFQCNEGEDDRGSSYEVRFARSAEAC